MRIEIVPDTRMTNLAKQALEVQDACNGTAVSGFLNKTMRALNQYKQGGDWVNQHPITKMIIDKMQHLARIPQDLPGMVYGDCADLADGKTVTVQIESL